MNINAIILFFLILSINCIEFTILRTEKYDQSPYINICFGNPPQCLDTVIDTTRSITCLLNSKSEPLNINGFDTDVNKEPFKKNSYSVIYFPDGTLRGYNNPMCYENTKDTFNVILIEEKDFPHGANFDNILGLMNVKPPKDDNTNRSFVNYLYRNNLISRRVFTMDRDKLIIGPSYIKRTSHTCKVFEVFREWNCIFKHIETSDGKLIFDNVGEAKNNVLKFCSRGKGIITPYKNGKQIIEHYKGYRILLNCLTIYDKRDQEISRFVCPIFDTSVLPGIKIYIDYEYFIDIPSSKLFYLNKDNKLEFIIHPQYGNTVSWDIGDDILKYETISYDMDDMSLTFYGGSIKATESRTKKLYIFFIIINLAGIFIIFSTYLRNKK